MVNVSLLITITTSLLLLSNRNKIQSGTWEKTQIVTGTSTTNIRDFIVAWVRSPHTSDRLTDSCIGAQCNPTCPRQLLFTDPAEEWGETFETLIIALSLVITVTCFGLKSVFMFYQYYLARKQKQFLNDPATSLTQNEVNKIFTHLFSFSPLHLHYFVCIVCIG